MKDLISIGILFLGLGLQAQNTLEDTIKIKEVSVRPEWEKALDQQEIESSFIQNPKNENLAELLSGQSSSFVKSYGIGSLATLSLRGAASNHSNILWNGILLNSSANGLVDLSLFPTAFIDEASIQLGTSSLESASGGLGGAVNVNSNFRNEEGRRLSIEQKWGSFGQNASQVSLYGGGKSWQSKSQFYRNKAANNFTYRDLAEPGFPEKKLQNASLNQLGLRQAFQYNLSEKEKLELELWYFNSERNLPSIFTVNNVIENQEDENFRLLNSYLRYGENSKFRLAVSALQNDINYRNEVAGIDNQSSAKDFKSFMDYQHDFNNSWSVQGRLNFDYSELEQKVQQSDLFRTNVSAYGYLEKGFGQRFHAELSGRQEFVLDEEDAFLPNLELAYSLDNKKQFLLRTSLGKNWKFPNLNDLYWVPGGNPDLKAERSKTADLSLEFIRRKQGQKIHLETNLSLFKSEIENYIQWQPSALGYWQANNIGEVHIEGLSTQLKAQHKGLLKKTIWFDYAYTRSVQASKTRIYDESEGKQLIYIPEHKYALVAEFERRKWVLNYNLQFMGARYTSSDNREYLPIYLLSDLSLTKNFRWLNHELNFTFAVLNLADVEYQAIEWRPMPGRSYQFTLSYRLYEK